MALLITYLLLALIVSFLCSIMEAVLLSTPQSFLIINKQKGANWAKQFTKLKANVDKPLSAILSLNTIAHTIGAAGVGAQAVKIYGEAYFGLISAILTVLILIITEIIPKTIGANFWYKLVPITNILIRGTIFLTYPLVFISSLITKFLSKNKNHKSTSREEIAALASIGTSEGIISMEEDKILQNILKLKNVKAREVMTPRVVVVMANQNLTLNEFLQNKDYLTFTRIPIYDENEEHVTGYVIRENVFENIAEGNLTKSLNEVKRNITVVPNSIMLFSLWEKLLLNKEHIALVVDEYGGVDGVVTLEDIIETILGLEIVDEKDTITDMQQYAKSKWESRKAKYQFLKK